MRTLICFTENLNKFTSSQHFSFLSPTISCKHNLSLIPITKSLSQARARALIFFLGYFLEIKYFNLWFITEKEELNVVRLCKRKTGHRSLQEKRNIFLLMGS